MGQYYKAVNLDKEEYIKPHAFSDGAKLLEFGMSASGMMCGLAILLADGNNRGGGDLRIDDDHPDAEMVGRWAGDRVVITGDYADAGKFLEKYPQEVTTDEEGRDISLYQFTDTYEGFKDVSKRVIGAMCADTYLHHDLIRRGCEDAAAVEHKHVCHDCKKEWTCEGQTCPDYYAVYRVLQKGDVDLCPKCLKKRTKGAA